MSVGCRVSVWVRNVGLLILVTAGGCTDNNGEQATPSPSTIPAGTITPPSGEEVDCGEYTLPNDPAAEVIPDDAFPEEHHCFLEALTEGTPAVLIEHGMTTEGDPIRKQMRVTGPNNFDLTHDATGAYGAGTVPVYTVACTGAEIEESRLNPMECEDPPD